MSPDSNRWLIWEHPQKLITYIKRRTFRAICLYLQKGGIEMSLVKTVTTLRVLKARKIHLRGQEFVVVVSTNRPLFRRRRGCLVCSVCVSEYVEKRQSSEQMTRLWLHKKDNPREPLKQRHRIFFFFWGSSLKKKYPVSLPLLRINLKTITMASPQFKANSVTTSDGAELSYHSIGKGPGILVVHGAASRMLTQPANYSFWI